MFLDNNMKLHHIGVCFGFRSIIELMKLGG